jgi:hypothetical protein
MTKLKRELIIKKAKNGFVLKVDLEQIVIYQTKEDLLWDLDKILDAETKDASQVREWVLGNRPEDELKISEEMHVDQLRPV